MAAPQNSLAVSRPGHGNSAHDLVSGSRFLPIIFFCWGGLESPIPQSRHDWTPGAAFLAIPSPRHLVPFWSTAADFSAFVLSIGGLRLPSACLPFSKSPQVTLFLHPDCQQISTFPWFALMQRLFDVALLLRRGACPELFTRSPVAREHRLATLHTLVRDVLQFTPYGWCVCRSFVTLSPGHRVTVSPHCRQLVNRSAVLHSTTLVPRCARHNLPAMPRDPG
jgi:hypothetical protein